MKNKALLTFFVIVAVSLPVLSGCNPGEKATLKVFTIGEGTINFDPEDAVQPVGTAVTVTAVAADGWDFDHWEGNLAGAQNPAQITLFTDVDIIAVFTKKDQVGIADSQFEDMEAIGDSIGWTFLVGTSDVSSLPVWSITGLVEPDEKSLEGDTFRPIVAKQNLPEQYDWRERRSSLTPVKYQSGCGSCWAFATLGVVESSILIESGEILDLAEQWLVDCNSDGYGCGGGWWSFDYLIAQTDDCGSLGAPLEDDYPYTALDGTCDCSNSVRYAIDSWSYVSSRTEIPSTDKIKQAIIDYGPVVAAVAVNTPFHGYREGVFNASSEDRVNHGIVIVGWDDTKGKDGVWIIKNSWGMSWGDRGYMYIEYDCSSIGYAAAYAVYDPASPVLPVAEFNATPRTISPGDNVSFKDESTPGSAPLISWKWNFGDGSIDNNQNPYHTYYNPGNYTVSLEVTTSVGSDTTEKEDYITVLQSEGEPAEGEGEPVEGEGEPAEGEGEPAEGEGEPVEGEGEPVEGEGEPVEGEGEPAEGEGEYEWIYNPATGNEYKLTTLGCWDDAEAHAQSNNAHLVEIDDQAENDWLVSTFGYTDAYALWIGLNDEASEGTWVWSNGGTSSFRNWDKTPPDVEPNSLSTTENWVFMYTKDAASGAFLAGTWNDADNCIGESLPGIMERSLEPIEGENPWSEEFTVNGRSHVIVEELNGSAAVPVTLPSAGTYTFKLTASSFRENPSAPMSRYVIVAGDSNLGDFRTFALNGVNSTETVTISNSASIYLFFVDGMTSDNSGSSTVEITSGTSFSEEVTVDSKTDTIVKELNGSSALSVLLPSAGNYTFSLTASDFRENSGAPVSQYVIVGADSSFGDYRTFTLNGVGDVKTITVEGRTMYLYFIDGMISDNSGSSTVQITQN